MPTATITYGPAQAKGPLPAQLVLRDGTPLAFRSYAARGVARARVLVLHGSGLNAEYYLTLGGLLAGRGIEVLLMDFRGHGQSGGPVGDAAGPGVYSDDLGEVIAAVPDDVPLFVFAHSGSAVAAIDLLSAPNAPHVAGLAMVAPTLAGDSGLTRTARPQTDYSAVSRSFLRFRPERQIPDAQTKFAYRFDFARFVFARAARLDRWMRVLSFGATKPGQAPYRYTARAATNIIARNLEAKLARLRCPVFVATSEQDAYVNGEAIATLLPWTLPADVPLRHESLPRGDHFTATLMAVPLFLDWVQGLCPDRAGEQVA
ncbi:pimeloyl-ACP methyl ester carboxylesterase [Sagittula marina]|uniref:Pimeloyl-ACP methyl ester carboxylesterase n=1 Tax=Sagittula marina TaxID=943940 RepID=A0A7W6GRA8_9RHOB|nr:alpha/beta hydrolase [Sagittula marina]MBB3984710.1 pimeloyl-ACP methyl ester carboxylesterase [Sagittula marina]